jgi:hypothetical protein
MVDSLRELKPGHIVFAGEYIFKIAKITKPKVENTTTGAMTVYETANVKTTPPGFEGGRLHKDDYHDRSLRRFVSGDYAAYQREALRGTWAIDMTCAAVGQGTWLPPRHRRLHEARPRGVRCSLMRAFDPRRHHA